MTNVPLHPPAGWYPDPAGTVAERFWDGQAWSQSTRDKPTLAEPLFTDPPAYAPSAPGITGYGVPNYGYAQAQPVSGRRVGGFWWRLLGFVIDIFIVNLVSMVITQLTGVTAMTEAAMNRWVQELTFWSETAAGPVPMPDSSYWMGALWGTLIGFALYGAYRVVFLGTMGATVGQLAVGLRTVVIGAEPEAKLGWKPAVIRGLLGSFFWAASLGLINGIFAAFSAKKQTLSDMASGTEVLKVR